jgi:hypothetical protein
MNLNGREVRPANDDMVEGYRDGFDLSAPEPSANRSESYRHGFANGRADKTGIPRTTLSLDRATARRLSFDEICTLGDYAMMLDESR